MLSETLILILLKLKHSESLGTPLALILWKVEALLENEEDRKHVQAYVYIIALNSAQY